MSQHTPEEWTFEPSEWDAAIMATIDHPTQEGPKRVAVARVYCFRGHGSKRGENHKELRAMRRAEGMANGYLVAAAPKLLEELERTAGLALELMERAAEIDRKLIAKDGREPDCELGEIVRLRMQLGRNRAAIAKAKGDTHAH